jgi:membrane-bound ClpP family serine protease
VIIKYSLLQIPELILILILSIWLYLADLVSLPVCLVILTVWLLKDFFLFFFVWKAYDIPGYTPVAGSGTTIEDLNPVGYIRIGSELWRATVSQEHEHIKKGQRVIIKDREGLTLIVSAEGDD